MTENKKIAIIASALLVLTFALCHVAARLAEFKAGMYMGDEFASVPLTPDSLRELLPDLYAPDQTPAYERSDKAQAVRKVQIGGRMIKTRQAGELLAAMFGCRPCSLAAVHPGVGRRLPLGCLLGSDRCSLRSAAECWEWMLLHSVEVEELKQKDGFPRRCAPRNDGGTQDD